MSRFHSSPVTGEIHNGDRSLSKSGAHGPANAPHAELRRLLQAAGCFDRTPWAHAAYIAAIATIGGAAFVALFFEPDPAIRLALLALTAFASVQAGFIAHEVGHGAVTGNRRLAEFLQQILFTVVSGVSSTYFRHIHRVHHVHLNEPAKHSHERPPSLSVHEGSALNRLVVRGRTWLVPLLVCAKTFSYKLGSLGFVWRHRATTRNDQIALVLHCVLWLGLPGAFIGISEGALNYVLVTLLAGPYIGTVLLLSHTGMATFGPESRQPIFARQLLATRNFGASLVLNLLLGGTNHHVEHHLFPTVSIFRLRRAREITRDYCCKRDFPYVETTLTAALGTVADSLRTSAVALRLPGSGSTARRRQRLPSRGTAPEVDCS
ncbi:MAG: fatty acid desaturase [Gammaproteobacteria bacterium]